MSYVVRPFNIAAIVPPEGDSPSTLSEFLGSSRPLDLEIGCGVGWHPIRYARENPDRNLIAIEHTRHKFERFQSRFHRHEALPNLLPVHADAIRWVAHRLPSRSIDRCFILYPNPEPKAISRRWIRMPFLHRLSEIIRKEGELVMVTNEAWYREEIVEWAKSFWSFELLENRSFTATDAPEGAPRTHFEKKYLQRGETCFQIRMRIP